MASSEQRETPTASAKAMPSYELFVEQIREFSTMPASFVTSRPECAVSFLDAIGGLQPLLTVFAADIDDRVLREQIGTVLSRIMLTDVGRQNLLELPFLPDVLSMGLEHSSEFVRTTTASLVASLVHVPTFRAILTEDDCLFNNMIRCLADELSSVSESISQIVIDLIRAAGDDSLWFNPSVQATLNQINIEDSTVTIRIMILGSRIACLSVDCFEKFRASGWLDKLLDILRCNSDDNRGDILLQMASFEVVAELAKSAHSLRYLIELPLGSLLVRYSPLVSETFLTNAALNFISDTLVDQSIIFSDFAWLEQPGNMRFLSECIKFVDAGVVQEAAICTVASIGRCLAGLQKLSSDSLPLLQTLPAFIMQSFDNSNTALATAAFHGLATVFSSKSISVPRDKQIAEAIYQSILMSPASASDEGKPFRFMSAAMMQLKSVDTDLRIAGYRFLSELATFSWGLLAIVETGGLCERLLDRDSEIDLKSSAFKFTALQNMSLNSRLLQVAPINVVNRIKEYVHQGPNYKQPSTQIMTV